MREAAPYDLLAADADRPDPWTGEPLRSYIICSTPRSGSTLLSELLAATGRLGTPVEYLEYSLGMPYLWRRWGCGTFGDYVRALWTWRTGHEGILGVKVHWLQLLWVAQRVAGRRSLDLRELHALLEVWFPRPSFVYIRREDAIAQAVSHYVAFRTQRWFDTGGDEGASPDEQVPYDAEALRGYLGAVQDGDRGWRSFFEANGIEPLEVTYEALAADTTRAGAIAAALLREDDLVPVGPPRLRRQSSSWKEELIRRFRAEAGASDPVAGSTLVGARP